MKLTPFCKWHNAAMCLSIALLFLLACRPAEKQPVTTEPKVTEPVAAPSKDKFELEGMSVNDIRQKLESGQYTSHALVQMYLNRIEQIDDKGPGLNAVIEINPDAIAIADSLDKERANKKIRGPLHGIPVLIKDNINTGDKMQTTAGSLALEGNIVTEDAFVVKKLREAGAIILGKTNLSEWANFRSTRSSSGWSSRGGQTKNPYILDRSPCGSSSGSAVAVAASLCTVGVGTETDGSIACPASVTCIVGIKPTVGLVSRTGIIPISKSQDTAGPFGRTVEDAVILLGAMTGVDTMDDATRTSEGKYKTDYTAFLNKDGLKGKRIGVEKTMLHRHEGVDALLQNALDQMKAQGATIVEVEYMKPYDNLSNDEFLVLEYEFKDGLNKYLQSTNGKMKSINDIIAFDTTHADRVMPWFRQEIMDSSATKEGLENKKYRDALARLQTIKTFINDLMNKNKVDALCGPASGPSWCIDVVNGDHFTGYGAYGPAAVAGYPSITVPMGMVHDLPVGISFVGKAYDESGLISIAYAYEQASMNRVNPKFIPTVINR